MRYRIYKNPWCIIEITNGFWRLEAQKSAGYLLQCQASGKSFDATAVIYCAECLIFIAVGDC